MTIAINPNIIISAVIIIVALAILLFILRGKDFSFSWKAFYSLIGIAIIAFLLYMGNYAIHQAFDSNSVRIVPLDNMPAENSVSVESYKATYDLFSSQFSQLLTFLGFFGTIFGLVIPVGAYLLQRQSIKDERKTLKHDIKKLKKEFRKKQNDFEEKIRETENKFNEIIKDTEQKARDKQGELEDRIKDITAMQRTLFSVLQTSFDGNIVLVNFLIENTDDAKRRIELFRYMLISFDNAVDCAIKSKFKKNLVCLVKTMCYNIYEYLIPKYKEEIDKAIENLRDSAHKDARFHSGEEIRIALGDENLEWYGKYKEIYEKIYPWKFMRKEDKGV